MTMGVWHSKATDRIALEVEFDQHHRLVPHDPTVMAGIDRHNLRRFVFHYATVGILDVNFPSSEEADVCVHAQVSPDNRFHVHRPAESGGIDHAFDARRASTAHIEPNVSDVASLGSLHRSEERLGRRWSAARSLASFHNPAGLSDGLPGGLLSCHVSSPQSAQRPMLARVLQQVCAGRSEGVTIARMSLSSRFFAATYDLMLAGVEKAGLGAHRKALLGTAAGRVIEIGAGTGANLPFYGDAVSDLVVCEPAEPMARRLERKLASFGRSVRVLHAPAESLPVESGSFDVAVSTLVLCTVGDLQRALAELHRVLKPGGRLLFVEHVRAEEPRLARWQDRLNFIQKRIGQGCNCNRDTVAEIAAAGFTVTNLARDRLRKVPPIIRPLVVGTALRP
jgi:ubiquinone/menaquinone biosynthesis C-methylase UbiE